MSSHPETPEAHIELNEATGKLRCCNCGRYIRLVPWAADKTQNADRERVFRADHQDCRPGTLFEA